MIDVSIIILNYNRIDLTLECVQSIVQRTEEVSYEIIVVDNASTLGDVSEINLKWPDVKIIRNPVNTGFAAGNNIGINKATGRYILLLNNDTVLVNNAIQIVHSFLKDNTNVGVATSQLIYPDGKLQHCCQRFPSLRYKLLELVRIQKILGSNAGGRILMGSFFDHKSIAYPDWIWGTFFMFPKMILDKFPNRRLNETFFMYWEDVQWCMEIRKLGYDVAYNPNAKVVHFMNASGGSKDELIRKNEIVFMKLYYGSLHRLVLKWVSKILTSSQF